MLGALGRTAAGLAVALAVLTHAASARGTYAIVASDTSTKEVGAAAASCVGFDITFAYGAAAARGVVVGLAYSFEPGRAKALQLLEQGGSASSAVSGAIAPEVDMEAGRRQYGIVDTNGDAAAFTGNAVDPFAGSRSARGGRFPFVIQGNFITSDRVLSQAEASFKTKGCDLPDRLMRALEAAATGGEGDARCRPYGIPATAAFLHVDRADGSDPVRLAVLVRNGESALAELRRQYDAWRAAHPCSAGCSGCSGGCNMVGGSRRGGVVVVVLLALAACAVLRVRARRGSRRRRESSLS